MRILWAWKEARKHPDRFIPAGTVFPLAKDILEMLDLLHAEGIRLAKIHPAIDLHDIGDADKAKILGGNLAGLVGV